MANAKEIKRRISSISNTAQITKALQMVSASKMVRAQQRAEKAYSYSEGLFELVNMLAGLEDSKSTYLTKYEEVKKIALVIVGPTRGFVGSQKSALLLRINNYLQELKTQRDFVVEVYAVGKLGGKIAESLGLDIEYFLSDLSEPPADQEIDALKKTLIQKFESNAVQEVHLAYTHFENTLYQEAVTKKLLPLEVEKQTEIQRVNDFLFEPSANQILENILPEYFENQIRMAILDSLASEHSARMVSMKNATDNAKELRGELVLKFNKSRQAKITEELIDIVSGVLSK